MELSDNGLKLIERFEGLRLDVYLDSAGLPTVGWGHLIQRFDDLHVGDRIAIDEAQTFLHNDIAATVAAVNSLCKPTPSQNQFDAMVSLAFNIGVAAFSRSHVLANFNAGNFKEAAQHFTDWRFVHGVQIKGLVTRRIAERDLFVS